MTAGDSAAGLVTRSDRDGIAILKIDAPPVNALGLPLRQALWAALTDAAADPEIGAIILAARGRAFSVGADITEFDAPLGEPGLPALCEWIEGQPKPVVAAIHAAALGGGLELALAARGRVALAGAQLGLPEVNLGLLPGAGGTQRLPRLIGAEQALRLMLTGRSVGAAEALAIGILDVVVEDGLERAALDLARKLMKSPGLPTSQRRDGLRDPVVYQKAVNAARVAVQGQTQPALARIIDCVEAAHLLPLEAGLAYEAAAFEDLLASPESAALRHVFFAERRAARFAETRLRPRPDLPPLQRIGVLGAAAADLAMALLQSGCEVALVEPNRPNLVQALEKIAALQEKAVAEGRLTEARRDLDWARLGSALAASALTECQAVLVADAALMPEAMAATAPGTLLAMIGRGGVQPQDRGADILGFRPAGARLVELVVTPATAPEQVLQGQALARLLGLGVLRSAMPGGVPGRIMAAGRAAVSHMVSQGEDAAEIAAAMLAFGLPALAPQGAQPRRGQAPAVAKRIEARVLGAMANEAARLLGQGLVSHPSEIDYALVAGQSFPRWQGGPLFWADRRGLMILRRDLEAWAPEAPEIWGIAPLLADLAGKGARFSRLP